MEALKKRRGGYKSATTKIAQKLTKALEDKDSSLMQVLSTQVQERLQQVEQANKELYELMSATATEEQLSTELIDADEWMESFIALRHKVTQALNPISPQMPTEPSHSSTVLLDENNVVALRHLYDECQTQVEALKALGITASSYGCLLSPIILKLLPRPILIEWNRRPVAGAFLMDDLMKFLRQEVEGRERTALIGGCGAVSKAHFQYKGNLSEEKRKLKFTSTAKALVVDAVKMSEKEVRSSKRVDDSCAFCGASEHRTWGCKANMDMAKRAEIVQKSGRCFQCLRFGHQVVRCYKRKCEVCNRKHHQLLCRQGVEVKPSESETQPSEKNLESLTETTQTVMTVEQNLSMAIRMKVAHAWVKGLTGKCRVCCLFDDGSQRSFIREDVVKTLKLPMVRTEVLLVKGFSTLGAIQRRFPVVSARLQSPTGVDLEENLEFLVIPEITSASHLKSFNSSDLQLDILGMQQAKFVDWVPYQDRVDILIGLDLYWRLLTGTNYPVSSGLMASESRLDWILSGVTSSSEKSTSVSATVMFTSVFKAEADNFVSRCWDLEAIGIKDNLKSSLTGVNAQVHQQFEQSIHFDGDRYSVCLRWKPDLAKLGTNRALAGSRLFSLLQQFKKRPDFYCRYEQAIRQYVEAGHAERVGNEKDESRLVYYIPHHAVVKEDRLTTKLQVVFDASCHEPECQSLNDCLWTGPNLNPDMVGLLLRFRTHQIAVLADIEKAFLQVRLAVEHRDATRFLWVTPDWKPGDVPQIQELRMSRVLFGASSSPYLLAGTIRYHLKQNEATYPDTCKELDRSLYVDDLASGGNNVEQTFQFCEEAKTILGTAGMPLKKWVSNSEDLLTQLKRAWQSESSDELLILDQRKVQKVLGLHWDPGTDCFSLQWKSVFELIAKEDRTKRAVLQASARIFDPLGFVAPVVIQARSIFQEAWERKIPWDDLLPEDLVQRYEAWVRGLPNLQRLKLDRWFGVQVHLEEDEVQKRPLQLHVFCDASMVAYGAVCYLRMESDKTVTSFVMSRGRVAPLKRLTLPRLELLATLIGARLAKYVLASFSWDIDVVMWTDSMVAIQWIKSQAQVWKPFVSNRVTEIQTLLGTKCWRHCPGPDNPADLVSRGCSGGKLLDTTKWRQGPNWLTLPEERWPMKEVVNEEEAGCTQVEVQTQIVVEPPQPLLWVNKFSSLRRLVRITAWIQRFIAQLRNRKKANPSLTVEELEAAMEYWIRQVQGESFKKEIQHLSKGGTLLSKGSVLRGLNPFVDKSGMLRLGGRLGAANLKDTELHPVILPGRHPLVNLIVDQQHRLLLHSGVSDTLSALRSRYWILKGRQAVKRTLWTCPTCMKSRLKPGTMVEAPLPDARINPSPAFQVSRTDFAGPLWVKAPDGAERKTYILLFTCAVTKAVHLELLPDLTTAGFLLAFRRFIARRGVCRILYSDNAKTYVCANKELQALWKRIRSKELQDFYGTRGIVWRFIVEQAAWWGGFWERLVRSVKTILKRVLGQAKLSYEELFTVLVEVEAVLNSRPLTTVCDGADDPEPLTPSHFLIGARITSLPDQSASATASTIQSLRRRWVHCQRVTNSFWSRWRQEYLLQLRSAHQTKNVSKEFAPKIGDLVLIKEANVPRHLWPWGIVQEVFHGRDGKVRSCQLRTKQKKPIRRPIQLLFPMEV